jgi:hypothetical protein
MNNAFRNRRRAILMPMVTVALAACAPMVRRVPTAYTPRPALPPAPELRLAGPVELAFGTGYRRRLAAGERWRLVGSVPEGDVYRRVEGVFTIEGRHVQEAYLVVAGNAVVGFYLPGEALYSPLSRPTNLPLGGNL